MNNNLMENIRIADNIERISIRRDWVDLNNLRKCCVVDHFNNQIYFIRENCFKYQKELENFIIKNSIKDGKDNYFSCKIELDGKIIKRLKELNINKCYITFVDTYHNCPNGDMMSYNIY